MKRIHIHVAVDSIAGSTEFYSGLFGMQPTVLKDDYAKWMLEDPRVNFAISSRGRQPGLDHLGIQVENENELSAVAKRLKAASMQVLAEGQTTCCYAKSEKAWVVDPQGIAWETFLTRGDATVYGDDNNISTDVSMAQKSACCAPSVESVTVELQRK
jgi:catechol-2,3-dioxygenase